LFKIICSKRTVKINNSLITLFDLADYVNQIHYYAGRIPAVVNKYGKVSAFHKGDPSISTVGFHTGAAGKTDLVHRKFLFYKLERSGILFSGSCGVEPGIRRLLPASPDHVRRAGDLQI
jgi:hypothetical protein